MNLEQRLEEIEFRMDLVRQGTDLSLYLYDCKITKNQLESLYSLMQKYRDDIDNGKEVFSSKYETEVLKIVDTPELDYHFCESFAEMLWQQKRFEEVFETLYKDNNKFKHLFEK